jgi:hypothetical protein
LWPRAAAASTTTTTAAATTAASAATIIAAGTTTTTTTTATTITSRSLATERRHACRHDAKHVHAVVKGLQQQRVAGEVRQQPQLYLRVIDGHQHAPARGHEEVAHAQRHALAPPR